MIDDHFFPETITVDEGSRSRLLCSVSKGDGPLRFQWFKDGRPLTSVPDGSVQYSDDSAMIKFRKMRFRDRGQYTCFATNDAAADNRTTDVIVNGECAAAMPADECALSTKWQRRTPFGTFN